ncbi:hypothetical protein N3K66_002080 [Trichothecium roseum]|uniref:Uncharacterized protein n=1 Tax=Trichothecium roseum TaxID=47278 RepID=A0ACC0V9C1_9HYPO|nr:hypothetical protein N3K66_002080 [Trichothecium roseum]
MSPKNPTVAVSAPGKVFLAGGYLVLDRAYTALVFGLSARISVVASGISTSPGVEINEVVVDSPQFVDSQWRYGYHLAPEDGGIKVTQLQSGTQISRNPFVETTLSYVLTYINHLTTSKGAISPSRLKILADGAYYSNAGTTTAAEGSRFARYSVPLSGANKTGLGSSAALVTSLTASLLTHYLPSSVLDIATDDGRRKLHNLAQAAHCAAQGKVGSGFDVAAAVYGSCLYRRFSPSILSSVPEPGTPGFGAKLRALVDDDDDGSAPVWDVSIDKDALSVPPGVSLLMCDVDCGSQTVGMVKKVLAWREANKEAATQLWDELQRRNVALGAALHSASLDDLTPRVAAVRELIREMSRLSDVPIEPDTQTELLDALTALDGVYGGVVPGAGGYDALALLMSDDDATRRRVDAFLETWSAEKSSKVKLLQVKGEMEGVRAESLDVYEGWL